jgi:hypothetical protein
MARLIGFRLPLSSPAYIQDPPMSIARLGPILMLAVRIFAPLPLPLIVTTFFLIHGRHSHFKFLLLSMPYPEDAG